jgi:hypothetical protein
LRAEQKSRHLPFRKTPLDYARVIEGEIQALMDEGESARRARDVQRGTRSWPNRSGKLCRMAPV